MAGEDFTKAILDVFKSAKLLKKVNAAIVSLVPWVPNFAELSQFGTSSCCNIIYKCLIRTLANKLNHFLPSFVVTIKLLLSMVDIFLILCS